MPHSRSHLLWPILVLTALVACSPTDSPRSAEPISESSPPDTAPLSIADTWRAVLSSPGGELPFVFEITGSPGNYEGVVINDTESVPFSHVTVDDDRGVELRFDWYDAEVRAQLSSDASVMRGRWRRTSAGGEDSTLSFAATRGVDTRFLPAPKSADGTELMTSVDGIWEVTFVDETSEEPAIGEFRQDGTHVTGTFLTPTGDYRFLEGDFSNGHLRLSTFDGAHAFLFTADANEQGELTGDFWSRDSYHATWIATPSAAETAALPDAWSAVQVTTDDKKIEFMFPDLDGNPVSLSDPAFAGRPVVVNIFGSWCPNCNDEAPLLARWHKRFEPQGLAFVGLAFEYTGDTARDMEMVGRFRDRHGIDYPLLLAGTSDKVDAAEALGFVDRVLAYPTTLFLDADHRVVKIHSGFAGPGTGHHHEELVADLERSLNALAKGTLGTQAEPSS